MLQIRLQAHEALLADVIQSHQEQSSKYEQMLNVSPQLCSWILSQLMSETLCYGVLEDTRGNTRGDSRGDTRGDTWGDARGPTRGDTRESIA